MREAGMGRVFTLSLAAIFLMVAVVWVFRFIGESRLVAARARFEAETGSLSLTDYVLPTLAEGENSATCLSAGAEALRIPDESGEVMAEILDQLSQALARESFLISSLMHLGVERLFVGAIRDVVQADLDDIAMLDRLQERLAGRDSAEALRRGIAGEAAAVLGTAELRGTGADSASRPQQLRNWFLEPFQLVALLDGYGEVAGSLELPWSETLERSRSATRTIGWADHEFLLTHLLDAVDKLKAVELSQLLAAKALDLAVAGPEVDELSEIFHGGMSDPYAAGTLVCEIGADGSATLAAPEAIDLWAAEHVDASARQRPIFVWRVPAP